MKGIDTNVLARYLVGDEPRQTARAARFIERECSQETPGYINRIVLCELVCVLSGAYEYSREQIADVLKLLMRTAELRVEDHDAAWNAIKDYERGLCDFPDSYLALTNRRAGCESTVTFDRRAARHQYFKRL